MRWTPSRGTVAAHVVARGCLQLCGLIPGQQSGMPRIPGIGGEAEGAGVLQAIDTTVAALSRCASGYIGGEAPVQHGHARAPITREKHGHAGLPIAREQPSRRGHAARPHVSSSPILADPPDACLPMRLRPGSPGYIGTRRDTSGPVPPAASRDRTQAPEGRGNVATGASPWSAPHDRTQAPEGRRKLMAAIRRPSGASALAPFSSHGLTPGMFLATSTVPPARGDYRGVACWSPTPELHEADPPPAPPCQGGGSRYPRYTRTTPVAKRLCPFRGFCVCTVLILVARV
jgi:hypothetical protein